jgi:hypothetical protein
VHFKCITIELKAQGCSVRSVVLVLGMRQSGIDLLQGNALGLKCNKFIVSQNSDHVVNRGVENLHVTTPCNW